MNHSSVFRLAAPCIAVVLSLAGGAARADDPITWSFVESYSRTLSNPAPGVGDSVTVTGSFVTTGLTQRFGLPGYQITQLLSANGWGEVIGLTSVRGEDNFLYMTDTGVSPGGDGLGFEMNTGYWTIQQNRLIGPFAGTYNHNFSAQAVPEPGAYALMFAGLAAIVWRRRAVAQAAGR